MTKTISVEATLVPTVVEIIAEPGDQLLVMNGVCIGVHQTKSLDISPTIEKNGYDISDADIVRICQDGPCRVYAINNRLGNRGQGQDVRDYVGRRARVLVAAGQLTMITAAPFTEKFPGFVRR